jgi:hypothetical protein
MRKQLYRWWLYRGPGFKRYRRTKREEKEILPPGFEIARDTTFGAMPDAATEVARLRSLSCLEIA